jgi:hypothetical protein
VRKDKITDGDDGERNGSAYLFLHIFLGPVVALLAVIALSLVTMPPQISVPLQFSPSALGEAPFVLFGIWMVGFAPAGLHAASMLLLHRLLGRGTAWVLMTPVMGWVALFLPLALLAGSDPRTFVDGPKIRAGWQRRGNRLPAHRLAPPHLSILNAAGPFPYSTVTDLARLRG